MTASWAGICCSRPPCVAVALRRATLTYDNIVAAEAFTVGIPSVDQVREVDYAGIVSGHDVDKFERTGWTAVHSELVNAPYVGECPVVLECELMQSVDLGLHTQFIGEIRDLKAETDVLGERNLPDIEKVRPIAYATGNRAYFAVGAWLSQAFVTREL